MLLCSIHKVSWRKPPDFLCTLCIEHNNIGGCPTLVPSLTQQYFLVVSFPDPPPRRKGGSGIYILTHYGLPVTADCKSCNKQAEQWKTTIDLLCLNREVGHAEAGKIIIFICGKLIVVFHVSACLLQDFCNLL